MPLKIVDHGVDRISRGHLWQTSPVHTDRGEQLAQGRSHTMARPASQGRALALGQVPREELLNHGSVGASYRAPRARQPAPEVLCRPNVLMDRKLAVAPLFKVTQIIADDAGQWTLLQALPDTCLSKEPVDHDDGSLPRTKRRKEQPAIMLRSSRGAAVACGRACHGESPTQ
jgi:hypothetical protein